MAFKSFPFIPKGQGVSEFSDWPVILFASAGDKSSEGYASMNFSCSIPSVLRAR